MNDGVNSESTSSAEAVDRVIRSFTDADAAIRELVASAERFRSASAIAEASGAELAQSRSSLDDTAALLADLVRGVATVSDALHDAALALRGVDQERIWVGFDAMNSLISAANSDIKSSAEALEKQAQDRLASLQERLDTVADAVIASVEQATQSASNDMKSTSDGLREHVSDRIHESTEELQGRIESGERASVTAITTSSTELREMHMDLSRVLEAHLQRLHRRSNHIAIGLAGVAVVAVLGLVVALIR